MWAECAGHSAAMLVRQTGSYFTALCELTVISGLGLAAQHHVQSRGNLLMCAKVQTAFLPCRQTLPPSLLVPD